LKFCLRFKTQSKTFYNFLISAKVGQSSGLTIFQPSQSWRTFSLKRQQERKFHWIFHVVRCWGVIKIPSLGLSVLQTSNILLGFGPAKCITLRAILKHVCKRLYGAYVKAFITWTYFPHLECQHSHEDILIHNGISVSCQQESIFSIKRLLTWVLCLSLFNTVSWINKFFKEHF
jgi:hypothetical protein